MQQGVYVPPHLRTATRGIAGSTVAAADEQQLQQARNRQQEMWVALNRSLTGIVNKVTVSNLPQVAVECLRENVLRGRGLFCRAIIRAQTHHVDLSNVFASLVAIVNSKVPAVGHLLGRRLIVNFKRYYRRREPAPTIAAARFIAHLCMVRVLCPLILLKVLASLLCAPAPTDDDIDIAMATFRDCFKFLESENATAFNCIIDPVRELVGGSSAASKRLSLRSRTLLEKALELVGAWQLKRERVAIVEPALDLVEDDDVITHDDLDLDDDYNVESELDRFAFDPQYDEREAAYEAFVDDVLGAWAENNTDIGGPAAEDAWESGSDDGAEAIMDGAAEERPQGAVVVAALPPPPPPPPAALSRPAEVPVPAAQGLSTEQVFALRKELFLLLKSSMRGEEVAHKILAHIAEGNEMTVAKLLIEAAYHETSFDKHYGIVANCLCSTAARYQQAFDKLFAVTYNDLEARTMKEIDIAGRFFGYLLAKSVVHWNVLRVIRLTKEETTTSTSNFIRVMLHYVGEDMGVAKLADRIKREGLLNSGMFPKDTLEHARIAVNFYGSISNHAVDLSKLAVPLAQWYEVEKAKAAGRNRAEHAL